MSDTKVLVSDRPFYTSDSYFTSGGKVGTILRLEVLTSTNRQLTFTDVIGMIPVDPIEGVELYHIVSDSVIRDDEKKVLIQKNAVGGTKSVESKESEGTIEDSGTADAVSKNAADKEDYEDYQAITSVPEPVVCFSVELLIIADTQERVELQLSSINTSLSKRYGGATFDSFAGEQGVRMSKLFDIHEPSLKTYTSTGQNYAWHNYVVSPGLTDRQGFEIGLDVLAIKPTESSFDFDGSLKRLAFIANPSGARAVDYVQDNDVPVPLSSVIAQRAANHTFLDPKGRKRVHHLVLNKFDYFQEGLFFRPSSATEVFKRYDMSRTTINPMQGFGRMEELIKVKSQLNEKIVAIFDVLLDLKLHSAGRAMVLRAVETFYTANKLWFPDAAERPERTKILNIARPELYPTMISLLSTFTTMGQAAKDEGNFQLATELEILHVRLSEALDSYTSILGRPTSLEPTDAPQVYYDFSKIPQRKVKQVQYLNLLMYVVSTAERGDVIVVHGADQLYLTVAKQTFETIEMAMDRGVRFIFAFDSITSTPDTVDDRADIFSLKGVYFNDLSLNVDYTFLGTCLESELPVVEEAFNTKLSETIQQNLIATNARNRVMIHRRSDNTNNFVYLKTII